jgi:mycoredoxin
VFRTSPRRQEITDRATAPVIVYGTQWCAATQMVRRYLDRMGIPCVFRDMDRDEAATSQVKWWTGGYASHPTLQIGGDILVEPTMEELKWTLAQNGLTGLT